MQGAWNEKKGKLEQANNGTIFLDEISGIDVENQGKINRLKRYRAMSLMEFNKSYKKKKA